MARTSSFQFTNTGAGSHPVPQVALGLVTNYALSQDAADTVKLNNKTAPIDSEEVITLRSRSNVDMKPYVTILNPAKVKSNMEYGVRVDAVVTTTDSADPTYRVDEPTICAITFKHPKSGNISETLIVELLERTISALMKADGSWRIGDLMRSAERPIVD